MKTYISILRGINVSGHRIIKMDALKNRCVREGFENIQTYIQSGNIVFQFGETPTRELDIILTKAIKKEFGFDVPVITVTVEELQQIVKLNPFLNDKTKDVSRFYVTFLSDKPQAAEIEKLEKGNYQPDVFQCINRTVYLYCPGNYGKSKLTNHIFEKKLGVSATTRNWKTVNELVRIAANIGK